MEKNAVIEVKASTIFTSFIQLLAHSVFHSFIRLCLCARMDSHTFIWRLLIDSINTSSLSTTHCSTNQSNFIYRAPVIQNGNTKCQTSESTHRVQGPPGADPQRGSYPRGPQSPRMGASGATQFTESSLNIWAVMWGCWSVCARVHVCFWVRQCSFVSVLRMLFAPSVI